MNTYVVTYGTWTSNPRVRGEMGVRNCRTLVINAPSREDAFCTAYDHLTRKGYCIAIGCWANGKSRRPDLFDNDEWKRVLALGVPADVDRYGSDGQLAIKSISQHIVKSCGVVVRESTELERA